MSTIGVQVGEAKFGYGAFSTQEFEAGTQIGILSGEVIDDPDYSSDYAVDLGGRFSLEPVAPFRFLNHNCEANCELILIDPDEDAAEDESPIVVLFALRDIAVGEELTIDYAWPAGSGIECGCGAKSCRGWIVAPEELVYVESEEEVDNSDVDNLLQLDDEELQQLDDDLDDEFENESVGELIGV